MPDSRRYSEQDIAAIFRRAAEAQESARQQLGHPEGLTLEELQQIGREVGLTPAFVAQAAAAHDHGGKALPRRTYLGAPVGVGRVVPLPAPLRDADWDALVADLRRTFHASGTVRLDGSLRQWSNGNLRVSIEPDGQQGQQIHLRTRKGNAEAGLIGGLIAFVLGAVFLLLRWSQGDVAADDDFILGVLVLVGLGLFGGTAWNVRRWAAERERQFEEVAARAVARTAPAEASAEPQATEASAANGAARRPAPFEGEEPTAAQPAFQPAPRPAQRTR